MPPSAKMLAPVMEALRSLSRKEASSPISSRGDDAADGNVGAPEGEALLRAGRGVLQILPDLGIEQAGGDCVDANVVRGQFEGEAFAHHDDAGFGCVVGAGAGHGGVGVDAGDVDDAAAAGGLREHLLADLLGQKRRRRAGRHG